MLSVASLMQEAYPGRAISRRRTTAGREEERRRLAAAIQELPELGRLALALRHHESLRPRQVAAVIGLSEEETLQLLSESVRAVAEILRRAEIGDASRDPAGASRRAPHAGTRA